VNIIYTGRISVEKNILYNFELIDFFVQFYLNNDYSKINFHIIGSGPYCDELKTICNNRFQNVLKRTTFYGSKNSTWIGEFYKSIFNPIFLFSSLSETFGKTGVEAMITGIPLFNIESNISKEIFNLNRKINTFLFKDKMDFVKKFDSYMNMNINDLKKLDKEMNEFVKKYDQYIIFKKWQNFL
jgi:glycosyltransferase involved in cell wall biosynthesis